MGEQLQADAVGDDGGDVLDKVVGAWQAFVRIELAPKTARKYAEALARFEMTGSFGRLVDATEQDVLAHLGTLEPGARYNAFWGLRSFYRWAAARDVCEDPTARVPRPRLLQREPRTLEPDVFAALVEAARRIGPIPGCTVEFLYRTAARCGEAAASEWRHWRADELVIVGTKSHRERTVAVSPELARVLSELRVYRAVEGSGRGSMFGRTYSTLYAYVHDAAIAAGLDDVSPCAARDRRDDDEPPRRAREGHPADPRAREPAGDGALPRLDA